jgi:hypothetical protein
MCPGLGKRAFEVSSILKALRKVEEAQPGPRETDSWSHEFNSTETIKKQARRSWGLRTGIAVIFLFAFLGLGSWVLYNQRSEIIQIASLVRDKPSEDMGKDGPSSPELPVHRGVVEKEEPVKRAPAATPIAGQAPLSKPAVKNEAPVAKGAAEEFSKEPLKKAPVPEPKEESSEEPAETEPTKEMDISEYRLEAIVWSKNPDSRFAVINGRIVRAGGYLGDISITAIERDGVRIRSADGQAELRFTLD